MLSKAKKDGIDEEIAKYDGKRFLWLQFHKAILKPCNLCRFHMLMLDSGLSLPSGKWAVEEMIDSRLPGDKGLVLKSRAKHHAISSPMLRPFVFDTKPVIVQ